MKRRPDTSATEYPTGVDDLLYRWLLVALLVEYARPASHIPFLNIPFLYTAIPFLLFAVSIFSKRLRPFGDVLRDGVGKWIFVLLVLVVISVLFSEVTMYAWETFRGVLGYAIFFVLIARIVNSEARFRGVVITLLGAHLFLLAVNPAVVTDPSVRTYILGATFLGDGNDFALSLCLLFPLTIYLARSSTKWWSKCLAWMCIALLLAAVVGTQSRGGSLGVAAVLLFELIRSPKKMQMFLAVAVIGAAVLAFAPPVYFERLDTIQHYEDDGSAQGRLEAWRAGIAMGADNPVLGIGAGHFGARWRRNAHSSYVLAFAELGFPGLVCVLALVFGNLRANARMRRAIGDGDRKTPRTGIAVNGGILSATSAAMIGYAVPAAFLSATYYPHLFVLTGLMIAGRLIATGKSPMGSIAATADARSLRARRAHMTRRTGTSQTSSRNQSHD